MADIRKSAVQLKPRTCIEFNFVCFQVLLCMSSVLHAVNIVMGY